jgi:two-component system chemotaxis sensor kinase CheA
MGAVKMGEMDLAIQEFLIESQENLVQMDLDLIAIEKNPEAQETLDSIFRTLHTIKGTCGFFEFPKLEAVTHAGESLLCDLRDRRLDWSPAITGVLLELVDSVRRHLAGIESTGANPEQDDSRLVASLTNLRNRVPEKSALPVNPQDASIPTLARQETTGALPPSPEPSDESFATSSLGEGTIRVDVGLLDKLMNQVGELVLARNQIFRFTSSEAENATSLKGAAQRLSLITSELQEGVMRTRMQPIGTLWNRFPRLVRDLSLQCRKEVRIEMVGNDTGLDKTILEAIKDPLTHLIRNAVDHGIEAPNERLAAGKSAEGTIHLRAYHEGGLVNIEIRDDGGGIDPVRIKQKALDRNLITPEQASRIEEHDLVRLIFLPGFSTARALSNVSGRGVGLDVVKTNVERIGGTVDLQSEPGKGTTFKVKIPLTLAIIPALIVTSDGERYAIPQVSLRELVRLEGEAVHRNIEWIQGVPLYRLRGELLPLVDLDWILGGPPVAQAAPCSSAVANIVVLQADDRRFGLVVPQVNDTEEIVVKPLARQLKSIPIYSGTTIMGDGRVALILDVLGISRLGEMSSKPSAVSKAQSDVSTDKTESFLLIGLGDNRRLAFPLDLVSRLEEIDAVAVERTVNREVMQYRGGILPLIRLSERFATATVASDRLQVVVATDRGRDIGFVVESILDIVSITPNVQDVGKRPGILGSAVLQNRVTDLLDVPFLIHEPTEAPKGGLIHGIPETVLHILAG